MTPASARDALADAVLSFQIPDDAIQRSVREIHQWLLRHSQYIRTANYTRIHPQDLEWLFASYDKVFFAGLCRSALDGRKLHFRLSPRMTKVGGTTARYVTASGETFYEITVASSLLFEGFGADGPADHGLRARMREPPGSAAAHLRARNGASDRAVVLADQQLRRAAIPGHRAPPLSASRPHAQADHAARTSRAIGNPRWARAWRFFLRAVRSPAR